VRATVIERPDIGLSRVCVLQHTGVQQCVYTGVQQRRGESQIERPDCGSMSECGVSISVFMRLFCLSWLGLSWFVEKAAGTQGGST
jgi:hypothetical protein